MKVYGHPMSTCTRKVLATLSEKGHEAEFVLVDLMKGEHKQPAHLARHPFGVIPAFEDDGLMIYESRAIIRYLDKKLSGPALTPTDLREYAMMEQWIGVEQSYFTPVMKAVLEVLFAPMRGATPDAEVVAKGFADGGKVFDVVEKGLEGKEYLAGPFSLADLSWAPYVEYLVQVGGGSVVSDRPNVAAWWKRVSSRPSWQRAIGKGSAAA